MSKLKLTPTATKIVKLRMQGLSHAEMEDKLGYQKGSVSSALGNIWRKCGFNGIEELDIYVKEHSDEVKPTEPEPVSGGPKGPIKRMPTIQPLPPSKTQQGLYNVGTIIKLRGVPTLNSLIIDPTPKGVSGLTACLGSVSSTIVTVSSEEHYKAVTEVCGKYGPTILQVEASQAMFMKRDIHSLIYINLMDQTSLTADDTLATLRQLNPKASIYIECLNVPRVVSSVLWSTGSSYVVGFDNGYPSAESLGDQSCNSEQENVLPTTSLM